MGGRRYINGVLIREMLADPFTQRRHLRLHLEPVEILVDGSIGLWHVIRQHLVRAGRYWLVNSLFIQLQKTPYLGIESHGYIPSSTDRFFPALRPQPAPRRCMDVGKSVNLHSAWLWHRCRTGWPNFYICCPASFISGTDFTPCGSRAFIFLMSDSPIARRDFTTL